MSKRLYMLLILSNLLMSKILSLFKLVYMQNSSKYLIYASIVLKISSMN